MWDVRPNTALILLGLGIISTATSLSLFGRDRVVFWREKAAGGTCLWGQSEADLFGLTRGGRGAAAWGRAALARGCRPTAPCPFLSVHAGIGALPYFLANTAVQIIDIVVQPLIFVAVYYSMTLPAISFMKV